MQHFGLNSETTIDDKKGIITCMQFTTLRENFILMEET